MAFLRVEFQFKLDFVDSDAIRTRARFPGFKQSCKYTDKRALLITTFRMKDGRLSSPVKSGCSAVG